MIQFVSISSVDSTGAIHSLILYPFKPTSGRLYFFNAPVHTTPHSEREKESERIDKWRGEGEDVSNERGEGVTVSDRGKKGGI